MMCGDWVFTESESEYDVGRKASREHKNGCLMNNVASKV